MQIQDKFTTRLKHVLAEATRLAQNSSHPKITTLHFLKALVSNQGSLAYNILESNRFNRLLIKTKLESLSKKKVVQSELSLASKKALEKAVRAAHMRRHKYIGTEHLLLGILEQRNSLAYKMLEESRVNFFALRRHIETVMQGTSQFPGLSNFLGIPLMAPGAKKRPGPKSKTPALDYFCQDLTQEARDGKLDPVIGRGKEIKRIIRILNRKTKNNPVLIGDPGVGKTAIVAGLAQNIIKGEVPPALSDKRILILDMALVVAGTTFRGEFEDRLKDIIREVKSNPNVILFIDEMHTIVGAGSASGSMDAANILKPALSRGEIQAIGATTMDEYRKHIEKDAALERRFQPVIVRETSQEETIEILKGLKEAYEKHHGIQLTDEALEAAVNLSERYVSDRYLPDKALDLLDEAASQASVKNGNAGLTRQIKKLEEDFKKIKDQKEEAISQDNLERALGLKRDEENLTSKISQIKAQRNKQKTRGTRKITAEHIAAIVSEMTDIPLTKLIKSESKRLQTLEKLLKKKIIGQDKAVSSVAKFIRRSRAGIADPKRPIGSFMFLGPTGVGKTELAKVVASEVFESEEALIKVDMSEFMEQHSVSKLIGAPAGYVGYEEGGKLTEAVRRRPYSVVLFDEIEKAHPEVHNILLQILEEGELTDAQGRKVNFKNTIIVLTSNIGSSDLARQAAIGFKDKTTETPKDIEASHNYQEQKEKILSKLRQEMPAELLGRLDKIVVFHPLGKEELRQITSLRIKDFQERLSKKEVNLSVSSGVINFIASRAFIRNEGARPIRGLVQGYIEDRIASKLISEECKPKDTIKVTKTKDKIKLEKVV